MSDSGEAQQARLTERREFVVMHTGERRNTAHALVHTPQACVLPNSTLHVAKGFQGPIRASRTYIGLGWW